MRVSLSFKDRVLLLALLVGCLAGSPRAWAGSEEYVLDPVHTRVMFAVEHAGFSKALGTISGSTGGLVFDPHDWTSASLHVSVPLQELDLGDRKWNRATLASSLLDAERFPTARFVSSRVERIEPDRARVVGMLTLHGITREVTLDVVFNALKRHPLPPFRRTVGFSATATINRMDFGISAWKSMIGEEVELRMEVEAVRGSFADSGGAKALSKVAGALQDEIGPTGLPAEAPSDLDLDLGRDRDMDLDLDLDLEPEPEPVP